VKQYEHFEGTIGDTVAESAPWWPTPSHPHDDAPNILVILIDDLGSLTQLFRLGPGHAQHRRTGRERASVLELPRHAAVLADAGGTADRKESSQRRYAGAVELEHRLSQHAWTDLEPRGDNGRSLARVRVHHVRGGSASRVDGELVLGRSVRPVAAAAGVRSLLRIPRRRDDQFAPDLTYDNHRVERPRAWPTVTTSARTSSTTRSASSTTRNQFDPTVPSSPTSPSARRTRPTRRPVSTSSVTAAAMTRAGTLLGPNGSRDKRSWVSSRSSPSSLRVTTASSRGTNCPRSRRSSPPDCQEAYAAFLEHTDARSVGSSRI